VVVTIDGPGGVGKSTAARAVAQAVGAHYLNTGSYYRAATLAVLRRGADPADDDAVTAAVASATFGFEEGRMILDGADVTEEIRGGEVTGTVSRVSAVPEVRTLLVRLQREWVAERGGHAVVEGRDIGTVVFPDADLKVFLTATEEARAERRGQDRESSGTPVDEIAASLRERDRLDSTRRESPLVAAEDAIVIDTTYLDAAEVVALVLRLADQD